MQKRFLLVPLVWTMLALLVCIFSPVSAASASNKVAVQSRATHAIADSAVNPLIYRVNDSDCKTHDTYFKLWNNTTVANGVCFAQNGTVNVNIYNVYRITSGNNAGWVLTSSGHLYSLCQWESDTFSPAIADVVQVVIAGRTCS